MRLGTVWKDTRAVLKGGDALSRLAVAALDSQGHGSESATGGHGRGGPEKVSINPTSPEYTKRRITFLVNEFTDVFAENPKVWPTRSIREIIYQSNTSRDLCRRTHNPRSTNK